MITSMVFGGVLVAVSIWWFVRRADREFRRGYLLAIKHIEGMTRPGLIGSYELDAAITKLREEMRGRSA